MSMTNYPVACGGEDPYAEAFPEDGPPPVDPGETAESFEADVQHMLSVARRVLAALPAGHKEYGNLRDAVERVEGWYEHTDDPRANGWVDDRGRP